jgi:peptidoglycan/LPS O-acetylase OafA/YrhL
MLNPTKSFFPNLDGLRFFAFFAVFINHAMNCLGYSNQSVYFNFTKKHFLMNGDLGVSFFFVLSGFLITYLLLQEKENAQKINVKHFYMRRILRIWPLYFFIVFLCLVVLPLFSNGLPAHFPIGLNIHKLNPWFYLTFTGNFDYLYHGISNVLIGVLWSVSVEEQFYLFWPLIVAFIPVKYLLPTFLSIIAGAIAFRFFYANGRVMIIKYHSLSSISDLATGAVIAYLSTKNNFIEGVRRIPKYLIIIVYCIGFFLLPFRFYTWKFAFYYSHAASIVPVLLSSFFAFIILEQNYADHSFYKVSKSKYISSLGKYTYGMYCYHIIVFFLVTYGFYLAGINTVGMNKYTWLMIITISFFLTILLSKFSYHYFESQFLRMKDRFS